MSKRPSQATNIGGLAGTDALPIDRIGKEDQAYMTTPSDLASYVRASITALSIGAVPLPSTSGSIGNVLTLGAGGTTIWNTPGTPSAHASSHAISGSDALTPGDIGAATATHTHSFVGSINQIGPDATGNVDLELLQLGTTDTTACTGNDPRLPFVGSAAERDAAISAGTFTLVIGSLWVEE